MTQQQQAPAFFSRTGGDDFPAYLKCMVTGSPKAGKTTLLGTVPDILILDTEPHANNLQSVSHLDLPYRTIRSTDDLRQSLAILSTESWRKQAAAQLGMDDIKAVAIDTMDTLQSLMKRERMASQRSNQFLRDDWGWLKEEMSSLIEAFTALPMHVFFLVHTKTENIGSEDNPKNVVLPGLEGAIAQKIAGMVGYSLHAFRKEELKPDGSGVYTKYWLRTEGDETYQYLGTRVGGQHKLPTLIEPDFTTIYTAAMANRPTRQSQQVEVTVGQSGDGSVPPAQNVQNGQQQQPPPQQPQGGQPLQTDVQTQQPAQQPQEAAQNAGQPQGAPEAQQPPAGAPPVPDGSQPINAQGLTFVKKVYEGLEVPFPEAKVTALNLDQARDLVKTWKAIQIDESENKLGDQTAAQVMTQYLGGLDLLPDEGDTPAPEKQVDPKVDGTIDEVKAYATDLTRVQEAYDLEQSKGSPRKSLVTWLESQGAKPTAPAEQPTPPESVSTPVENAGQPAQQQPEVPEQGVTPDAPSADASVTEEEGLQNVQQGLGAQEVVDPAAGDKCEICGGDLDDEDIANLGLVRFKKKLCVQDYLAETKKPPAA